MNIYNYTGANVSVEDRAGGRAVIIGEAVNAVQENFLRQMATGQGVFPRAIARGPAQPTSPGEPTSGRLGICHARTTTRPVV